MARPAREVDEASPRSPRSCTEFLRHPLHVPTHRSVWPQALMELVPDPRVEQVGALQNRVFHGGFSATRARDCLAGFTPNRWRRSPCALPTARGPFAGHAANAGDAGAPRVVLRDSTTEWGPAGAQARPPVLPSSRRRQQSGEGGRQPLFSTPATHTRQCAGHPRSLVRRPPTLVSAPATTLVRAPATHTR
jgi:hypothetical protein